MYLYCKRRPYLSPAQHRHMRLGLGVSPRTVLAFYEPHIFGGWRLAEGQMQCITKRDGRANVRIRARWVIEGQVCLCEQKWQMVGGIENVPLKRAL